MNNLKVFTENIEDKALEQIITLMDQPAFSDCKVRIMPDVHAGTGCVIGFTANLGYKVIPNIVGVDIGCGMLTICLGNIDVDFEKIDTTIRAKIPAGRKVYEDHICPKHSKTIAEMIIDRLYCKDNLIHKDWLVKSMGTLGGGNHFIEVDTDNTGNKYLIIHTGSRNLGKQVAEYYQKLAIDRIYDCKNERNKIIEQLKKEGREKDIQQALSEFDSKRLTNIPKELCYLEGEDRDNYLHDMQLCQEFAMCNRLFIAQRICNGMNWKYSSLFHTVHNYIDNDNIVRKGAISAKLDETLLIPINMRDGCILGKGKGNEDWNYSAPHGAGRIMSRMKAKETISIGEYTDSMKGIYTTCINPDTIDESPMVYKPIDEIVNNIKDTVDIIKIIKPIYNFKAGE